MPRLFTHGPRSDSSPSGHAESSYAFLDRVHSLFFGRVRNLLEEWYANFPDADSHLRSRLCSDDDRSHAAAFWELYLHAAYVALGLDVKVHPDLGTDSNSAPDFLVHGSAPFVVEAKLLMTPAEVKSNDARISPVYDAINEVTSDNFFVWASVLSSGSGAPSLSRLKRDLERWLSSQDPDSVSALITTADSLKAVEPFVWSDRDWTIEFSPIPKKEGARGKPGRLLGMSGPIEASNIDDHTPLVRTLKAKAPGRYGDFDYPYVIAVLSENPTVDEIDVASALFGREAVQIGELPDGSFSTREIRNPDGFWHGPHGIVNTRVSGVLVAHGLFSWTIATSTPRLWVSPYTISPLNIDDHAPWATSRPDHKEGEMVKVAAPQPMHELFGIEPEWPGENDLSHV